MDQMSVSVKTGRTAPNRPARSPGPIDLMHLARQSMGDPGLELEMLRIFDDIVRTHFWQLERSTTISQLLIHLHTLRGASVGMGAWRLAQHAHIMEAQLKGGGVVDPEQVEDINAAVDEVRAWIAGRIALGEAEAV